MSRRAFFLTGLVVALVIAGFISYWASSAPDGLNKVAEDKGLNVNESDSATADSPLADYSTAGVDNERLSGAIAGVAGVAIVLVLAGGLFYVVARREDDHSETSV
jgi:cobalt/nickel transport protein